MNDPTKEIYNFLSQLYALINKECFEKQLPNALITVKGKGKVFGYYKHNAYVSHEGIAADELAVNPLFFATHGFGELLQTMGHEMCHQWQQHYGKALSRRSYHNAEFRDKMLSIGLIPSATGKPGGAQTGQCMADYMGDSGAIVDLHTRLLDEGIYIPWYEHLAGVDIADSLELPQVVIQTMESNDSTVYQSGTTRMRYIHQCGDAKKATVYGKPNLPLVCGDCGELWEEANQ